MVPTPSLPVDLQEALCRFVDARIDAKIGRAAGAVAATIYSQIDGQRPIGAGRSKYRRIWHLAFDARDPEARREGRALLMSAACWARWCSSIPSRAHRKVEAPPAAPSALDDFLSAGGARRTA